MPNVIKPESKDGINKMSVDIRILDAAGSVQQYQASFSFEATTDAVKGFVFTLEKLIRRLLLNKGWISPNQDEIKKK